MAAVPPRPVVLRPPPRRRHWLLALAGGLILPLDPVLGVALVVAGLWAGQRRRTRRTRT